MEADTVEPKNQEDDHTNDDSFADFIDVSHMMTQQIQEKRSFICQVCNRDCAKKSEFVRHMRTHTGDKPYSCETCGKTFALSSNYNVHIKIHSETKSYECNICHKSFSMPNYLRKHMKIHNGLKYSCDLCPNSFNSANGFKRHRLSHLPATCNVCHKIFPSPVVLKIHMKSHNNNLSYPCQESEQRFTKLEDLDNHILTHARESESSNDLNVIHCETNSEESTKMHSNSFNEKVDNFQNEFSEDLDPSESFEVFVNGENLRKDKGVDEDFSEFKEHENEADVEYGEEIQENLNEEITSKDYLNPLESVEIATGENFEQEKDVVKDFSEFRGELEPSADMEYRRENQEDVNEDMTSDDDMFIDCANIMKQEIKEIKKYVCDICDRDCGKASELKRHLRTHTGDKPFKCHICEKTFALSSNYNVHIRIHSNEKPYICNVCDKAFAMPYYLKKHMKTHLGKKPHSCMFCGNAFTTPTYLKKHIRIHHVDVSEAAV